MDHAAVLEFEYADTATARIVERSVTPEIGDIDDDRSRATLDRTDRTVVVTVEARDLVALRAALNTWCRLLDVAEACDSHAHTA